MFDHSSPSQTTARLVVVHNSDFCQNRYPAKLLDLIKIAVFFFVLLSKPLATQSLFFCQLISGFLLHQNLHAMATCFRFENSRPPNRYVLTWFCEAFFFLKNNLLPRFVINCSRSVVYFSVGRPSSCVVARKSGGVEGGGGFVAWCWPTVFVSAGDEITALTRVISEHWMIFFKFSKFE